MAALPGETLLSCFRRHGIAIESTCNGKGICGKCAVRAAGALPEPDESEKQQLAERPAGFRLACRAVVQGPVSVDLDETCSALQTVYTADQCNGEVDSPVRRIPLPEVDRKNGRPYLEDRPFTTGDPGILDRVARWERTGKPGWGIVFENELIDVTPNMDRLLGAAVDIGTTGLSLYLYDLETGELIGKSSALNPQTTYGGDVITRIIYCREKEDGLATLKQILVDALTGLLDETIGRNLSRDQVYLVTIAGNTTMLHLMAGVSPVSLALFPFRPAFLRELVLTADASGLPIHPHGRVILLPGTSAYIGADIIAGLQAIDYRHQPGLSLFIDIGTNGEMVLFEGPDRMVGASCAVGPALEGMNIACGCRAIPGAIDSFFLDKDLQPTWTTINSAPPVGICGSGLIELTAALVQAGLIPPRGAFNTASDPRLLARLNNQAFHLVDGLYLSQKDIRQVQLAKGAVLSGLEVLLSHTGHQVQDLSQIIVAGAFGYHLDPESLKTIGLLPPKTTCPVQFVGNSSLAGAAMTLLNQKNRSDINELAQKIEVIDLAAHPDFQDRFIAALNFPG